MNFPMIEQVVPILFGSSTSGVLGSITNPVNLVIPRQARRLATIFVHLNVTIATPTSTASRNALEGILDTVALKISDKAGSSRTRLQSNSASLLAWNKRITGRNGRFSATAFGKKAAGTYDLIIPVHVSDPTLGEVAFVKTSIPLWATDPNGNGIGEDARLELTFGNNASVGLSAGTVTVNYGHVQYHFIEMAETVGYVPSELITSLRDWGTSGGDLTYEFPEKGWLASFMVEGFTSATARGDVQSSGQGMWRIFYGRSERAVFTTKLAQEQDGLWAQEYPTDIAPGSTALETAVFMRDGMGNGFSPQALSPGAIPNLYLSNAGDRAYLRASSVSANAQSNITNYKFLVDNLATLQGV